MDTTERDDSATELHGLVIHPDGGHGMLAPGHLHPSYLHPLVFLPCKHLISVVTILIITTCHVEHSSYSHSFHHIHRPGQRAGYHPGCGLAIQDLCRVEVSTIIPASY